MAETKKTNLNQIADWLVETSPGTINFTIKAHYDENTKNGLENR